MTRRERFAIYLRRWADRLDPLPTIAVTADTESVVQAESLRTMLLLRGIALPYVVNYRRRLPDEVMNIVREAGVPMDLPTKKRPPNAPRVRKSTKLKVAK